METRPPIGIKPELIWREQRYAELMEAVQRYEESKYLVPPEWFRELWKLAKWKQRQLARGQ